MTIAVNTLVDEAGDLLGDSAHDRWSSTKLIGYLNEGQRELVTFKPDAKVAFTNHLLATGAKQSAPTGTVGIINIHRNVNGGVITRCDRDALDSFDPNWMTTPTAGSVIHWMSDAQPETFWVYPAQNGTPATVVAECTAIPSTVSAGGNIDVRDIYASKLVNFMLFRAYSEDGELGNAALAAAAYQLFKE